MKLVRFGAAGSEKPGLVDAQGRIRDLSAHVPDVTGETLAPANLARLRALDPAGLPLAPEGVRLGPPVAHVWNFIGIGLNFTDHAKETNSPVPTEPILFNKLGNCIVGPNDDVMLPKGAQKFDYEVEIAFVIGTRARYVEEREAASHIAGYTICNDVSERHFQLERSGQWVKGKSADTFCPLGPWLVTADEIADPQELDLWLEVNGERMQTGSTRTMVAGVYRVVSYTSQFMTLQPGDVIPTGTPPGVGMGRKPQVWLKPGDEMRLGITGLGEQRQRVKACER